MLRVYTCTHNPKKNDNQTPPIKAEGRTLLNKDHIVDHQSKSHIMISHAAIDTQTIDQQNYFIAISNLIESVLVYP